MDVREKLVELQDKANSACVGTDCSEGCKFYMENDCLYKLMADVMKENGVTVQEWISVKDRLPEDGETVTICTEKGFVYAGELIGDTWFLDNDSWTENVTHWMPMPQPPKGE